LRHTLYILTKTCTVDCSPLHCIIRRTHHPPLFSVPIPNGSYQSVRIGRSALP
jgi:hypothetical protein